MCSYNPLSPLLGSLPGPSPGSHGQSTGDGRFCPPAARRRSHQHLSPAHGSLALLSPPRDAQRAQGDGGCWCVGGRSSSCGRGRTGCAVVALVSTLAPLHELRHFRQVVTEIPGHFMTQQLERLFLSTLKHEKSSPEWYLMATV